MDIEENKPCVPRFITQQQNSKKNEKIYKMCKFFAWGLDCPYQKQNTKCQQVHAPTVKKAFDDQKKLGEQKPPQFLTKK